MNRLLILLLAIILLPGCMSRTHRRPVEVAGQLAYEEFKIKVPILMDSAAAQVSGDLKHGDYKYKVGASEVSVLSDEEFAKQLNGIVSSAVAKALNPAQ